jgi:predicted nuclease of predicted toxin-antitoxin system
LNLLLDQDVYALTVRFLRHHGHDVLTASELGLSRAPDTVLLARAQKEGRIFITRDKDFGALVFVESLGGGVILLRITPSTVEATHGELGRILSGYTAQDLAGAFVIVQPGSHRFRRIA